MLGYGHEEDSLLQTVYISHAVGHTMYKIASVKMLRISRPKWHVSNKFSNFLMGCTGFCRSMQLTSHHVVIPDMYTHDAEGVNLGCTCY
jgi:hypothetical protein